MTAQREWFEKDYYKVLGVAEDADPKDITRAYRKLARKYHPDANPNDSSAEDRFKDLSAAYDVIGDPAKRQEYDQVRRLGPVGSGFGGGGFNSGGSGSGDMGDISDILSGLFNRGGQRRGPGRESATRPRAGEELSAELHLSFLDAVRGVTTTVSVMGDAPCSVCSGSGAAPGGHAVTCSRCGGRGVVDDNQGFFSFSSVCPACSGQGSKVDTPCASCKGNGLERRNREVKVRIRAGVEDGSRIRVPERGQPGRFGGPAGDLLVTVRVASHELFGRKGRDLTLVVPIAYHEAVLGAEVVVPTLDGTSVTLKLPPGTRSGRTFRVKGRGVASGSATGDLLVSVELAVPTSPSANERRLVEELAKLSDGSLRAHLSDGG